MTRKFFYDLLYVHGDLAARHPDFFKFYKTFHFLPYSVEKILHRTRKNIITDKNEYYVVDGVLFKLPWGSGSDTVYKLVETETWKQLKREGKIFFVSIEPGTSMYTVNYIYKGKYIYPVRIMGKLVTIYFHNGYVTTDINNFRLVKRYDDAIFIPRIYTHSYVDVPRVNEVLKELEKIKGTKIFLYPGRICVWKRAYTLQITPEKDKMIDPIPRIVDDPVLAILSPYLAQLIS